MRGKALHHSLWLRGSHGSAWQETLSSFCFSCVPRLVLALPHTSSRWNPGLKIHFCIPKDEVSFMDKLASPLLSEPTKEESSGS